MLSRVLRLLLSLVLPFVVLSYLPPFPPTNLIGSSLLLVVVLLPLPDRILLSISLPFSILSTVLANLPSTASRSPNRLANEHELLQSEVDFRKSQRETVDDEYVKARVSQIEREVHRQDKDALASTVC